MAWPKGKPRKAAIVSPSISTENTMSHVETAEVVNLDAIRAELAAELAKAKELTAKLERKTEIREEVSEAVMNQRRKDFGKIEPAVYVMPPKPENAVMFAVKLEKNYAPVGYFEVVGWDRPKIEKKGPGGVIVVIQEAAFIKDERAPPAVAGTGYANKIWAGTTIKLPEEEAKHVDKVGIARRVFD
jgi:hypothetical protein